MAPTANRRFGVGAFRLGLARSERTAEVWKIWLSLMRCVFMALISPSGDDLLAYFKVNARVCAEKVVRWATIVEETRFRFLI
ncbi:MAG: hypothetical protein CME13_22715 [Gemmatimonadetes bacterium]|nr:hypothetical protein [Gemmatimonadota bacterium]